MFLDLWFLGLLRSTTKVRSVIDLFFTQYYIGVNSVDGLFELFWRIITRIAVTILRKLTYED